MTATAIINALKQEPIGVKVLIGLGLLVLGNVATHLLTVFYNRFLSGSKNLKKYGAWGEFARFLITKAFVLLSHYFLIQLW